MTIEVYSKPACVQCNATYRALDKSDVSYSKTDMSQDVNALDLVRSLGFQQAPVVLVRDGEEIVDSWSGFRPDKIKELVNA